MKYLLGNIKQVNDDRKKTTANIGLAIWLKCFYKAFVQGSIAVILLNVVLKSRHANPFSVCGNLN